MKLRAPLGSPLLVVHRYGRGPGLEYLPPTLPLRPYAILFSSESLHSLGKLVFQLGPIVVLKLNLRIHLQIHGARSRGGSRCLLEVVFVWLVAAVVALSALDGLSGD